MLDRFDLTAGKPTEITSRIAVETSAAVVAPGEQFTIDLFIENIADLDKVSCTLEYYKDEPPALLTVVDAQPRLKECRSKKVCWAAWLPPTVRITPQG